MSGYIKRTIESSIKKIEKSFPVVMITGPRQVGKTTLLNMLMKKNENKKINYISLDDLSARTLAIEDPELFLRTYEFPLIIDEFQYAPDILSYIKIIVDKKRLESLENNTQESNGLFYLTGSQAFQTMKNVTESLAGRVGILDLYGLSTREINGVKEEIFIPELEILSKKETVKKLSTIELYEKIITGSYPQLYKNKNIDRCRYFETYIRTYIERDIRQIINIQDELKFLKFINNVAARTGQELNITDICNGIGISNLTGDSWLSILTSTGLVYLLQPYSNNTIARIVKKPKIYFMDTGLACYLSGYINATTLEKSAYNGAIFETYVISEIIKSYANNGIEARKHLYYYRDNNGKEIDLIIINNNVVYPIEIKKSANPGKEAIKNFGVVEKFGMEIGNGGVICMKDKLFPIDRDNNYIPIELV
jgi:predicted AAA+ superfamily ATPase